MIRNWAFSLFLWLADGEMEIADEDGRPLEIIGLDATSGHLTVFVQTRVDH